MFSDRFSDLAVKLDDSDQYQELAGVPLLYSNKSYQGLFLKSGCTGSPGRMDCVFCKWLQKQIVHRMDVEKVME